MKKKIIWITGDYFIDVDLPIIPVLVRHYEIEWVIIKSFNSQIEIPEISSIKCQILNSSFRTKDPRSIYSFGKLLKRCKRKNPDLIYLDYVGFPYFHFLVYLIIGNNNIVHAAHNVIPYNGWSNKRLMTYYINFICHEFKYFHIFSKHLKKDFLSKYSNKESFYAPLCLKDYGMSDNLRVENDNTIRFLFFGNIKANKRLELLLNAYMNLPDNIKAKSHLTIAGKCENIDYYENIIKNETSVTFHFQYIKNEEIPVLFSNCHFLVLPYENVAQSGPHMIAYNYNLPVIASNIDGFTERVIDKENGLLFEVNNQESLTSVLNYAIEMKKNDYLEMKKKLKEYVEINYSKNVIAKLYIEFFDSIINKNEEQN